MNNANRPERRTQTRELIDKMLAERKQMLVLLCKVSGLKPFESGTPVKELLKEFCQVLVDYIASAHFGLYQRIAEGTERRQPVLRLAEDLYPRISETTRIALAFNEKYEKIGNAKLLPELQEDLSHLSEALAVRVELEDQLIHALTEQHPVGSTAYAQRNSQPR